MPVPPIPSLLQVRRGNVRAALLALLAEEPRNGHQMIEEISRRSGGVWRPSPGSVYPSLQQLEDEGLVVAAESAGTRVYRLTDDGQAAATSRTGPDPWTEVAQSLTEDRHEMRLLWGQLAEAFIHLTQVATDEQVAQTKKLLKNTRREMFRILAGDDDEEGDR
ncbi:PadR family transcriptional regulator [Herbidospora mongoliensis]|uniref:PadR family transcriptional regulator n=1 Tax=Herbidospora mongoliensis TaxID=688067 RepID=UPI00082D850C|nr:helix-turn-helix transcriptional regulator [Herbidospora mongoliensis]